MASLLGGEYCIESLRRDVSDLQGILDEVHSRVGPVKYQSWKFPDKSSCDVDIINLLARCQYNKDDDEECQMSHVMLYDLVIDRLVYLLQSFLCFNEVLLNVDDNVLQNSPSPASRKRKSTKSMSIGLTAKKCWGRITQIAALLQKLAKEVNSRSLSPIVEDARLQEDKQQSRRQSKSETVLTEDTMDNATDKDISCDVRTISCQTHETAYSTCETCSRTQNCLNDVGRAIVDLCKSQNLPTALEDYQTRYKESVPMSVADLVRWSKYQSKDLSRISRHMSNLVNQVTPLKADLATVKKSEQKAKSELQQCESVYQKKDEELKEEFRRREYVLKQTEKDLKKKISALESVKTGIQEELDKCHWKISDLKDELLQKHRDQLAVENTVSQLKEEAVEGQQYKKDALKFKSELTRIQNEFEETKNLLNHNKQLYERESTKNCNMLQHEKMLQEKQKNLLSRMESMTEDCEKMREQILNLEDDRDVAIMKLEEFENNQNNKRNSSAPLENMMSVQTDEIKSLHQGIETLRSENDELRSTVTEYTERERLLVAYPDLNQINVSSPMVQGSGDVFTDMQKQIEANEIRIQILDKENDALQKTLEKVGNSPDEIHRNSSRVSTLDTANRSDALGAFQETFRSQPIQLWRQSDLSVDDNSKLDETENSPEALWYRNYQTSKSPMEKSSARSHNSRSKPPSGRQRTMVLGSPNKAHKHTDVPAKNGFRVDGSTSNYSSNSLEAYRKIKQQHNQIGSAPVSSVRSSFTVGSGKRPKSGRPSSAKSAMFKPWT